MHCNRCILVTLYTWKSITACICICTKHHVWVFPLLPERQQKLRTQIVYNGLPKFLGRLLYSYLHPLLGADELSGWSWQLVTAMRDEGDGLSLCERLPWGYDRTHCRVTYNCCCGDFSATSSSLYLYKTGMVKDSVWGWQYDVMLLVYPLIPLPFLSPSFASFCPFGLFPLFLCCCRSHVPFPWLLCLLWLWFVSEKSFWLVDLFFPEILHFLSSSLSFLFKDLCESAVWCEERVKVIRNQLPWCIWNFCIQHTCAGCGFVSSAFRVLPSSCSWSWMVSSNILRLKFLSFNSCHISIYQKTWNSW